MEFTSYTVKSGDTLSGIARRFGVAVHRIAEASGILDPDRIRAGEVIRIPVKSTSDEVRSRVNRIAVRLHRKIGNPDLESALLANFNRETGGSFDYRTRETGGSGYGIPQFTGQALSDYRRYLAENGLSDSEERQIDFFVDVYMPTRKGYSSYVRSGFRYSREQYADWLHRNVFSPAHTTRSSHAFDPYKIAKCTKEHNDFMRNNLRSVDGVWRAVLA